MEIYAASYVLPISSPAIPGGAIAVEDGVIKAVGTVADIRQSFQGPVTDLPGCTIMPGMVNTHTHLELTHFPAWKLRKGLDYLPKTYVEWIQQVVKIRRALLPGEVEQSIHEGLRLCLEAGTTAVGEILTDFTMAPLYRSTPLAGRIFLEALGHDPVQYEEVLQKMEQTLKDMQGRLLPGVSPHTPYTVSPELFKRLQDLATRLSLPKAIHLSEPREEVSFVYDTTGPFAEVLFPMAHWEKYLPHPMRTTSTCYLRDLGVLDGSTLAIHAVHVTPDDAAILREAGVTVVLCPRSNDRLFVGRAPHHLLKKAGIGLALGTDSLASNDSLSLLDEIRFLQQIAPGEFTAGELLQMATLGGARALGIDQGTGTLVTGKRGDFLVFSGCVSEGAEPQAALLEKGRLEQVYIGGNRCAINSCNLPSTPGSV